MVLTAGKGRGNVTLRGLPVFTEPATRDTALYVPPDLFTRCPGLFFDWLYLALKRIVAVAVGFSRTGDGHRTQREQGAAGRVDGVVQAVVGPDCGSQACDCPPPKKKHTRHPRPHDKRHSLFP